MVLWQISRTCCNHFKPLKSPSNKFNLKGEVRQRAPFLGEREAKFYIIFATRVTKFSDQLESVFLTSQRQFSREIFFSFFAIAPKLHYSRKSMQRKKKRKSGMGWSLTRSAKSLAASLMNKLAIKQGRWDQGGQIITPQYYFAHPLGFPHLPTTL